MSALLKTILTMSADEQPEGSLTGEPYALLGDGRAMWLVPVEGPVFTIELFPGSVIDGSALVAKQIRATDTGITESTIGRLVEVGD